MAFAPKTLAVRATSLVVAASSILLGFAAPALAATYTVSSDFDQYLFAPQFTSQFDTALGQLNHVRFTYDVDFSGFANLQGTENLPQSNVTDTIWVTQGLYLEAFGQSSYFSINGATPVRYINFDFGDIGEGGSASRTFAFSDHAVYDLDVSPDATQIQFSVADGLSENFNHFDANGLAFQYSHGFSGTVQVTYSYTGLTAPMVPEPTSWALFVAGFGMVGASLRRSRKPRKQNA